MMDVSKMVRDPRKVHADLVKTKRGLITKGGCTVYLQGRLADKELLHVGEYVNVLGTFAITTDGKSYGVSNITAMVRFSPDQLSEIEIDGAMYYELKFNPGSEVIPNRFLGISKTHVDAIMTHFGDYARCPWWMSKIDHAELFLKCPYWNQQKVFDDAITADIWAAQQQRSFKDPRVFARTEVNSDADLRKPANWVGLRTGIFNKSSNLARVTDVNMMSGIRDALTQEPVREDPLEQLYRR